MGDLREVVRTTPYDVLVSRRHRVLRPDFLDDTAEALLHSPAMTLLFDRPGLLPRGFAVAFSLLSGLLFERRTEMST